MYSNFDFIPVSSKSYRYVACDMNSPGSARPPGKPNKPFLSPLIVKNILPISIGLKKHANL